MSSEPRILRSALLDAHRFAHGFSLRTGGVSEGAFESLNLARTVGDDPAHVAENVRRFCSELGADASRLYEVSQVHGRNVVCVDAEEAVGDVRSIEADGLVTGVRGHAIAVRTADCVPILLGHPRSGAVAAVHAGWRGVVARILDVAVAHLGEHHGAPASELVAAIGPHIRVESFEVGPEVASRIAAEAHGEAVVLEREPRPHVDLARAVRAQLVHAGLAGDHVDDVGGCTLSEPTRFFSHRRDAGHTGRMLSAILAR